MTSWNSKATTIAAILTKLCVYYERAPLSDDQMDMYVEDLMDMDSDALIQAIKIYRRDARNNRFPLPSQLKALSTPSDEELAREAVARIVEALSKYSDTYGHQQLAKTQRARDFIGSLGWLVVQRNGGWQRLSQLSYDDIGPTAQAQWRELAIALAKKHRLGIQDQAPELPGVVSPGSLASPKHEVPKIAEPESVSAPIKLRDLFRPVVKAAEEEMTEAQKNDRRDFLRKQLQELTQGKT